MANWSPLYLKYKDDDGNEKLVFALISSDATPIHIPGGVTLARSVADPTQIMEIPALDTGNGVGLQVANLLDSACKGTVEPDQPDSGGKSWPVGIGGIAYDVVPVDVGETDRVRAAFSRKGALITLDGWGGLSVVVNATASGNTTVLAAPGASLRYYIKKGALMNTASTKRKVALQDGAGGTAFFRATLAADGGGVVFDFGSKGKALTLNTLLNVNLDAGGDVEVNITDYYVGV